MYSIFVSVLLPFTDLEEHCCKNKKQFLDLANTLGSISEELRPFFHEVMKF